MRQSKIAEELETLIRARYPLIYVVTWEEPRLDAILSSIAAKRGKKLFVWSISRGLLPFGTPLQSKKIDEATRDPAVALDRVVEHVEPAIFCFKDFHPFMSDPVIVRKLRELAQYLKSTYTTVVLSSPTQRIPMELEKDIAVVEFGLPDEAELRELLERTIEEVSRNTPIKIRLTEEEKERIVQAALGLTLSEAENVFAKTLIKRGGLGAEHLDVIISEKEQIVRKSGLLEYYHSTERFDDVGGLDLLKDWLRKRQMAFTERAREYGLPTPKGVLLIGVQGCGKSLTAKAVASLWKVPLLRLDMSRIFSSLVGASEENLRNALRVAESVSPCILWVDELEKSFAGAQSSALSDAGTTARVLGYFLTWLQEKTAPCFVIATANSIEQLPPELLRKGRLDEIFFVDLPSKRERMEIFAIHLRKRKRDPSLFDLEALAEASQGFSGAEIEQAVISALYDAFSEGRDITTNDILKAIRETVPLSVTMKEQIDALREWASGRARRASSEESEEVPVMPMRRLEI